MLGVAAFMALAVPMGEAPPVPADNTVSPGAPMAAAESGPEVVNPYAETSSNQSASLVAAQPGSADSSVINDLNNVFRPRIEREATNNAGALHFRNFDVDPELFCQAVAKISGSTELSPEAFQKLFASIGLDMRPEIGKNIFYKETQGWLLVRGTKQDLDAVQAWIGTSGLAPLQINIKTTFVEVSEEGFRSFLGSLGVTNIPSESSTQQVAGALTAAQFRSALSRLEHRNDAKTISEAQVTTLSGRQCQIQTIIDTPPILFESTNGLVRTNVMVPNASVDIIPTVEPDGRSIRVTVTPALVEFLGYDDPGTFVVNSVAGGLHSAESVGRVLPMPHFRVRQMSANVRVGDGQTLVLARTTVTEMLGEKTVLPTRPLWEDSKHRLLVFITPTLIDSNGNRVNPDEAPLQFDQIRPEDWRSGGK
jgi:type II secretory pathway component GspD/PulD (secretin)